jgi:hypothetical protein
MLQVGIALNCQLLAIDPKKQAWYVVIVAVYIQVLIIAVYNNLFLSVL